MNNVVDKHLNNMTKLINISYFFLVILMGSGKISSDNQVILTNDEVTDLTFLLEEEKLARDVYLYAFEKHNIKIFESIADSEQIHMNKILTLLEKYGIKKTIKSNNGEFSNPKIQGLYNTLTKQSEQSIIEALTVGVTIEDLDIYDIESFKKRTDNSLILDVYSQLTCGSKNHLRAFYKQLVKKKSIYEAQYISKKLFKSIVKNSNKSCGKKMKGNDPKKKGKGHGKGNGQGRGQGQGKKMMW
jgi:hypothetical protein